MQFSGGDEHPAAASSPALDGQRGPDTAAGDKDDKVGLKAEKHVAKELDLKAKDIDKAVQEAASESRLTRRSVISACLRTAESCHQGAHMRPASRRGRRPALLLPAAALVLSGFIAGCSDSKPAYCADADQLKTSVQNLGNVDVATNGVDSLKTALSSVQTDANAFAADAKSELAPQVTALQGSLSALDNAIKSAQGQPSAATVTAIGSSVSQVKSSASDLENAASDKCK